MPSLARRFLFECYGCDPALLDDGPRLLGLLAARTLGATTPPDSYRLCDFEPVGQSGALARDGLLVAFHTWPEHGYATVDLYLHGGQLDPSALEQGLRHDLGAERIACHGHGVLPASSNLRGPGGGLPA